MIICIDLVPTEICGWNCNYCVFPLVHNPKHTSVEIIDRHYLYIRDIVNLLKRSRIDVQLYLQGGEVGELPEDIIEYILSRIDSEITISTNGLFMKKNYHKNPNIKKYIKQILWHVTPDCELVDVDDVDDVDDDIKIVRGVVHKDEECINNFVKFTKLNIEYSKIENPLSERSIIPYNIIDQCRSYHNYITIDLVNEKLCLCIRNFNKITIPLNKSNIIKLLKSFPKDVYDLPSIEKSSCYSCCRLCSDRANNKIFENRVKLMSIFKDLK